MTQPAAISTIGVRHGASFDGAGAAAVDMKFPGQLRERIGAPKQRVGRDHLVTGA
jgi:hypothetical protein